MKRPSIVMIFAVLAFPGCGFGEDLTWPPPSGSYACDESATRGICHIYQASGNQTLESAQASCQGTVSTGGCPTADLKGACEDTMGPEEFYYGNFVNYAGSPYSAGTQSSQCRTDGNTWHSEAAAAGLATLAD